MATIRPFQALRPNPEKAGSVAAVPYDVVSSTEARKLSADNPLSFLHVSRAEIDLEDAVNPYSDAVYQQAAQKFEKLRAEALTLESSPSLYIYRLKMGGHEQSGIAACCSADEYDNDIVRKHERTRKDKEDDRTRHMLTLRAQTGPIFMTYEGRDEINGLVSDQQKAEPLFDFEAPDGIAHTLWRVSDDAVATLVEAFGAVPLIYIADGHHRAASASRARDDLRSRNPNHTGNEDYNFFLSVLFPADQVRILAYNRIVTELTGMSSEGFLKAVSQKLDVAEAASPQPQHKGQICMYMQGRWYSLTLPAGTTAPMDPLSSLDVNVLQERVLSPLLDIKDVTTDKRIDFVGGIRGAAALEHLVDEGFAAVAFSMFPVGVDELIAIADAGQIMPPKSTWFEPKLRDGLLIHLI